MQLLFVHQNCPGQYKHLAQHYHALDDHEVTFFCQPYAKGALNLNRMIYSPHRKPYPSTHRYIQDLEAQVLNGQAVAGMAMSMKQNGYRPDIIIGHNGWGETLYLKDVWPDVPMLSFFEFYYGTPGGEIGFDMEPEGSIDELARKKTMNVTNLLGLEAADWGQAPTRWQHSRYPEIYQSKISIVHDGIDTQALRPNPKADIKLGRVEKPVTRLDEIVTFVARNLEPVRGFHMFMRALPELQKRRPNARIVIVGGDRVSYGAQLQKDDTWRKRMLKEVGSQLDMERIHFLGMIPYDAFVGLMQVSSAHVYLTYPFVLSWSMLEAMAVGALVIGSKTPPVEEVIRHGKNGLLVDFFSPSEIVDRVCEVLEHKDLMQDLRDEARETVVKRYDLRKVCLPRQKALVEDLVNGRQPRRY